LEQLTVVSRGQSGLGDNYETLSSTIDIGDSECRHATSTYSIDGTGDLFCLVWMEVSTSFDYEILLSTSEEKITISEITEVAGVKPSIPADELACGLRVSIIPGRCRGAPKLDMTLIAIGYGYPVAIDHTQLMIWENPSCRYDAEWRIVVFMNLDRKSRFLKHLSVDPINLWTPTDWCCGQPDRTLRQAVDWTERFWLEAIRGKTGSETV
jgi:hypothetical protein